MIMSRILVIMAAGMGSRFGGDKQITGIGPSGEFLMEYSVYDAIKAGFDRIILVIRPGMQQFLQPLFDRMSRAYPTVGFYFAEQCGSGEYDGIPIPSLRTKPLGTVHALLSAAAYLDAPFAVINADDYYGRDALASMASAMAKFKSSHDAAMVAYSLDNTLSRYGAVTRGICSIEDGLLKSIKESYKVMALEDGSIVENADTEPFPIPFTAKVSMNIWAYHNDILPYIKDYFTHFLSNLDYCDNESECLLPVMAESFIKSGKVSIAAYSTDCRWFGLTYRQDAEDAAWELDKRHQDGTYPDKLF